MPVWAVEEDEGIELVLRTLEGDVAALLRAYAVNTAWKRVCSQPSVWTAVRW